MNPHTSENIVLIGMPGAGKSTTGVLLAKKLSMDFIDTDVYIQAGEGKRLQDIIEGSGMDEFRRIEERYILSLDSRHHVISTGGSVVYSEKSMAHLKTGGVIVYLTLDINEIGRRIHDMDSRGIVRAPGQTIYDLLRERSPLYARFADITVECAGLSPEKVVSKIASEISARGFVDAER